MHFLRVIAAVAPVTLLASLAGCETTHRVTDPGVTGFERQCTLRAGPPRPAQEPPAATDADVGLMLIKDMPGEVQHVAHSVGLVPLLAQLHRLKTQSPERDAAGEVRILKTYQRIQSRLMLAMAEVSSTAGVLRCEQARAEELADALERTQTTRNNRLTLVSIVLGGITDAVTGGLSLLAASVASGAFGVGGGVIETAPGVAALFPNVQYEFFHSRNYLAEIWDGPRESKFFPRSIWQFLTDPRDGDRSLRDQLLEKWNERTEIEDTNETEEERRKQLLLGDGGFYRVGDLRARGALLQLLAATIDLMHDDLEDLIRDILVREPELGM